MHRRRPTDKLYEAVAGTSSRLRRPVSFALNRVYQSVPPGVSSRGFPQIAKVYLSAFKEVLASILTGFLPYHLQTEVRRYQGRTASIDAPTLRSSHAAQISRNCSDVPATWFSNLVR